MLAVMQKHAECLKRRLTWAGPVHHDETDGDHEEDGDCDDSHDDSDGDAEPSLAGQLELLDGSLAKLRPLGNARSYLDMLPLRFTLHLTLGLLP